LALAALALVEALMTATRGGLLKDIYLVVLFVPAVRLARADLGDQAGLSNPGVPEILVDPDHQVTLLLPGILDRRAVRVHRLHLNQTYVNHKLRSTDKLFVGFEQRSILR